MTPLSDSGKNLTPLHQITIKNCINYLRSNSMVVGDRLPPERLLAEAFSVSRSTLRTVIKHLVEKGILKTVQGSGTYIAQLDFSSQPLSENILLEQHSSVFEQLLEFRKVFEPEMAAIAAKKCSHEQLNKLKLIVSNQQKQIIMHEGDEMFDAQFHLALAEATENIFLVETMEKINQLYTIGRNSEFRDEEWMKFSVESHFRIVDAIEKKSPKDCKKELEKHLSYIFNHHIFFK